MVRLKPTNLFNLPQELYDALVKDRYTADEDDNTTDYSVTSLVAPTQQTLLKKRYPGYAADDAMDRMFVLYGHLMHKLLEEHGHDDSITEKRFYKVVNDRMISGQLDHYKNRMITDYKCTSVYKIKKKNYDEWAKQLNLYSILVEEAGYEVDSLRLIVFARDWRESESHEKDYPAPVVIVPLVKWSREARYRYLNTRVSLLVENENIADHHLPRCTNEERWMNEKDWAVLRPNRKSAVRVFASREEGLIWIKQEGREDDELTHRYNPPKRCIKYCSVKEKCNQHRLWMEEQEDGKKQE
jgi:hypothetical protein